MTHERLHDGLRAVGAALPEAPAPERVRARVIGAVSPLELRRSRARKWVLACAALGGAAACLAITLTIVALDRAELREQLARGAGEPEAAILPVGEELMVVNYHHDLCPVSGAVTPRFNELASKCRNQPVRFVTLDLSDDQRLASISMAHEMGLDFLFEHQQTIESGLVQVVDVGRHAVVMSCRRGEGLDDLESRLAPGRGGN